MRVALFTVAKIQKQSKCLPTDEWIKVGSIQPMEYYAAIRENEILPLAATWTMQRALC